MTRARKSSRKHNKKQMYMMFLRCLVALSALTLLSACQPSNVKPNQTAATTRQSATDDIRCSLPTDSNLEFTSAEYDDLWDRMRAGYSLQHPLNDRTQKHLDWYKKHPRYMERVTERGSKFLHYIVEGLDERNMPHELALLPIVESAFDPFAYSHGRASGIWQFVPATGKHFGLKQNWWYDGRRDAVAATDAALDFLLYLNRRFDGDWLHALAAYNAGEGNVRKAIRRNKKAGKPTDFWSLKLPRETQAYVPQLLALAEITQFPEQHGLKLSRIVNQPYLELVDIGSQIDLAQASDLAGLSIDQLYQLNAGFNRWATDPKGPHRLVLPVTRAEHFREQLATLPPQSRTGWERYKIKAGDSLIGIAKHFNTNVGVIKDTNNIRNDMIRQGQTLLIPVATQPAKHYAYSEDQRVKRKQALSKGTSGSRKVTYKVKSGDSFWKIAKNYGVKVSSLAKWNAMAPKDPLKEGQQLVIWSKNSNIAKARQLDKLKPVVRKVAYRVRSGDSLARIAGKFHLSVNDIVRWNKVKKNGYIHPGQSLTLFVDVTGNRY